MSVFRYRRKMRRDDLPQQPAPSSAELDGTIDHSLGMNIMAHNTVCHVTRAMLYFESWGRLVSTVFNGGRRLCCEIASH